MLGSYRKASKHTQSPSGSEPGTNTLISLDFADVIEAPNASLLKYNWQPAVLSTEIVGAEPYTRHSRWLILHSRKSAVCH